MLICLEASARGRRADGLDGGRAARPRLRRDRPAPADRADARARARRRRAGYGRVGARAARSGRRRPTGWSASRRPSRAPGSTRGPGAADATPLLAARARDQDRAGARADAARERDLRRGDGARARRAPAGDEGERGGGDLAGVRPRRGHRLARARSSSRSAFSLVWSGPGIRTFTATGDRPVIGDEPTLFEIWVCADGYWCDHTKNLVPRRAARRLPRARGGPARRLRRARSRTAGPARASPSSTVLVRDGHRRARLPRPAVAPDLPRRRRARPRAAVRPPGGRRRDRRRAWCSRSSRACYWEGGGGLRVEDNFLITRDGAEKLSSFPDGVVAA